MTTYKRFIEQQNLPEGRKKRPGQAGCDGNSELRTKVIQFTLSPREFTDLNEQYMKSPCSTMAVYCREKSLSKAIKVENKAKLKIDKIAELYKLSTASGISQTGKMGSNINQIAWHLNSKNYGEAFNGFKEKMLEELKLMREMNSQLEKALKEMREEI